MAKSTSSGKEKKKGKKVVIVNDNGKDVIEEENGKEIRTTRDFGCGLDVHSLFIEVNVLVKNNLSVYEYRKSFDTDWISVNKAKEWVFDTIRNNSNPPVNPENNFHYTLESTATYHCVILAAWGGHPSIVNPYLARSGTKKTDKLDARGLSLADLTGVWEPSYIPSIDVIELRMLVDERKQFMSKATQIGNHINNLLLKLGINLGREGSVTKSYSIRSMIEAMFQDEAPESDDSNEENKTSSEDSNHYPPLPSIPESVRCVFKNDYEEYDNYCRIADDYFKRILDKIYSMKWETGSGEISGEEMMSLLTSTPGVGNQTAVLWLSRVITPRRFKNEKALAAYCGLDPSLKVSAGKVTSTVKRGGRKDLHSAFCMSASTLMRRHTEPFGKFGYNIAIQNGIWKKGVSALARKLATSMYYVSLRGEPFSYEKYKMINEPDVLNVSVETLVLLEPSFKRYLRFLYQNDIKDTKTLVHKYFICELPSIKGLGKNFFALVKDFINNQKKYNESYERMVSNEDNT